MVSIYVMRKYTQLTPPTIETQRKPNGVANFRVSTSICCANSRVGANISAYGPKWRFSSVNGGRLEIYVSMGMTNAAVLPEPDDKTQHSLAKAKHYITAHTRFSDTNQIAVL